MNGLSPMMEQYFKIKEEYPDTILFFRLGDFYEMFFEDAKTASRELELVLTGRDCGQEERAPMCGVPFHSADGYIAKLISRGYKVAICEQTEDPALAKGLVKRDVIRVVTPGTVIESCMLDEGRNNYLSSICLGRDGAGVCFIDVSTGEVHLNSFPSGADVCEKIINELGCFKPSEVLFNKAAYEKKELEHFVREHLNASTEQLAEASFSEEVCRGTVTAHIDGDAPYSSELKKSSELVRAFGAALAYLENTQRSAGASLGSVELLDDEQYMTLDISARRNLELTETLIRREKKGSLLWVLDKTGTAMGKRLIRSWLEQPLTNCARIIKRQNAVEELYTDTELLSDEKEMLTGLYDLERIMTRVVYNNANAKELRVLSDTIEQLGRIKSRLSGVHSRMLSEIASEIDPLEDIKELIDNSIVDDPPLSVRDGGMIKKGCNSELDELHEIAGSGRDFILDVEKREQDKTGIKKLKIGYNRVFGYYIEVTNSFKELVPETYIRKQTLANCERYITEELKQLEGRVLGAQERIVRLEYELFSAVRESIAQQIKRVRTTARAAAALDVLCSFASVARSNGYVRPTVDTSDELVISEGRHPVVELMLDTPFVPNDTALNCGSTRTAIITGPNMAGKSTYMRQVALIVLMAQTGSFVPASSAKIGITDKIFTRVGASDDLSRGQSTFMLEMSEVAYILTHATKKSLLVFDEIGRGTSTYDGMSIARAVLEYTNDKKKLGAKTLFATHYHELCDMEDVLDGVKNYNTAVKKRGDSITFLRRITEGPADGSYGIEVAALAGVPQSVVERAKSILDTLGDAPAERAVRVSTADSDRQMSFGLCAGEEIAEELKALDVNTLTPIEALGKLYELCKKAKEQ